MNKLTLTEIKRHMETCCIEEYERLYFLISLLEEKDKALEVMADENNWTRRWTENSAELVWIWTEDGKTQDIARKALNTSSNNEGEV